MMAATRPGETKPCETCGTVVDHLLVTWPAGDLDSPKNHHAPCGALCIAGGVSPELYGTRQVHGMFLEPCPKCGERPRWMKDHDSQPTKSGALKT